MRKKILGFVFAAALLVAMAVPLFGGGGTALAGHEHQLVTPGTCVDNIARGQTSISDPTHGGYHNFHANVHIGTPGDKIGNDKGKAGLPNNPVTLQGAPSTCP